MTTVRPLSGLAMVGLDQLHPSPNNPRTRLNDLDELAASIREAGLVQPIIAQRIPGHDGLQIVAGHRRHAAAKRLGLLAVPVVIRRDMLPDEELLLMLVENGQRTDLDPIEEAHALAKLKAGGLADAEVARRVGRHLSWVRSRLDLLRLSPEDQEEVRAGHYSLRHAHHLVRASRAETRKTAGAVRSPGRPKGRKTTPYFSEAHPLAKTVRARCTHRGKPKVGNVGCGECWEAAIRADEASVTGYSTGYSAEHRAEQVVW